jgi:hypothetical protein
MLAMVIAALSGCARGPSSEQLDEWLAEARAADAREAAAHAGDDERAGWTLTVVGSDGRASELRWEVLDRLADTTVDTDLPPEGGAARHAAFRVVTLSELLDTVGGAAGSEEITLVAYDGFRATIATRDLLAHPIGLAVEADGAPIPRSLGGPLFTVLPITASPVLTHRYTSSAWVFYVTHVLAGTPPPHLRVDDDHPGEADDVRASITPPELAAMVTNRQTLTVGYRTGWSSEPVVLEGVLIRDLLALRGIALSPGDEVHVTSIAPLTRGARPTVLTADEVLLQPTMLATRWAPGGTAHDPGSTVPIPARLGGPVTLAVPPAVQARLGDRAWLTFVDALIVVRGGAP